MTSAPGARGELIAQTCEQLSGDNGSGSGSSSSGGDSFPSFAVETMLFDDGAFVQVRGALGQRLVHKVYNEDFLESGRRDEFTVPVDHTGSVRFVFWGDHRCDFSEPSD